MKILILSDSHHKRLKLDLSGYDYVIHCGDYGSSYDYLVDNNVVFVQGNCDFKGDKDKLITINNKKIFITHGDLYDVKSGYTRLMYKSLSVEANIVLFGHTHAPFYEENQGIIYINPGSFADGLYVIIDDDNIHMYFNEREYKTFKIRW